MTKTETVLFNVSANLVKGMVSHGGKLKITESELIFSPHKVKIKSAPVTINLGEITKIQKQNSMLIVPNGMSVTLKSGKEYKFVVNKRNKLIDHLNQTIGENKKYQFTHI